MGWSRKFTRSALLVGAVAAAGIGGVTTAGASGEDRAPGWAGEMVAVTTDGPTMDPAKLQTESSPEWDRAAAIFDTLMLRTQDGGLAPLLAESLETEDAQVWTLTLRDGITFTDGTPLDADAVVTNFERQQDPANACGCAGNWADLDSVEVLDPLTIQITLNAPNGTFGDSFGGISGMIASPTALEADPEGFGSAPVGAGPYTVTEYVRDDHLTLTRNPDFWDDTRPAYETITQRYIVDPSARAEAAKAGDVNVLYAAGAGVFVQLGDTSSYGMRLERSDGYSLLLLNQSQGPAQDIRVREAIVRSIDPARVNAALLNGLWESETVTCPPFSESDPECLPDVWPQFDPDRAAALVEEYVAEGNSPDISLLGSDGTQSEVEFLQQSLNAVGFNVTLDIKPGAEWLPAVNNGEFEIAWYALGRPVQPRMDYLFRSEARNLSKANVPEYDAAVLEARTAVDPEARLEAWHEVQRIAAENFMFGWYSPFLSGYAVTEDIDLGDQLRSVFIHLSLLAPTS